MTSIFNRSLFFSGFFISAVCSILSLQTSRAANFTWDGGGTTDNWTDAINWAGNVAPSNPSDTTGAADVILFGGTTRTNPKLGVDSWYADRLEFTATAGAFTIGDALDRKTISLRPTLSTTSHDSNLFLNNLSAATQTVEDNILVYGVSAANTGSGIHAKEGNIILNGNLQISGAFSSLRLKAASGKTLTINGAITGSSGGWAVNDGGTVILNNNNNTFSGNATIWSGTLKAGAAGALGSATTGITMGHGSFNFNSALYTTNAFTISRDINFVTPLALAATPSGTAGQYIVGSESTGLTQYTGTIFNGTTSANASAVTLDSKAATGRVNINAITRNTGATGTNDSVTKIGAGIVAMMGTSNYSGNTLVQQGTFLVNGTIVTGSNNVQVSGSATLGGAGTINRSVTIAAAGILSAGDMTGTTSLGGKLAVGDGGGIGLSLANTSVLNFDLASASSTVDDEVSVSGNLILDGVLNVNNLGGFGNGTYRLFDFSGTLTDNGLDLVLGTKPAGFTYAIQITNMITGRVNLLVTPEPGRALLVCAGLAALFLRRRRTALFSH